MDQKAAIKFAPPGMKEWLQLVVGDHKFRKFEADGKWSKKPTIKLGGSFENNEVMISILLMEYDYLGYYDLQF